MEYDIDDKTIIMSKSKREVLLIGNGFDLAHDLPTKYSDFLQIIKAPSDFLVAYNAYFSANNSLGNRLVASKWSYYFDGIRNPDNKEVECMVRILEGNPWARYYAHCNSEIDGWVDFEHEISPVIDLFSHLDTIFSDIHPEGTGTCSTVVLEHFEERRLVKLWPRYFKLVKYIYDDQRQYAAIADSYFDSDYGVLYKKIAADLWRDFQDFIIAFRIYIVEFVSRRDVLPKQIFCNMKITDIVSFNFTSTFSKYWSSANTYYVHGSVEDNDMILGVNSVVEDSRNIFKRFEKGFQRLERDYKSHYMDIIDKGNYDLTIFGHSLDETDRSVLIPFLNGASHIHVYYYATLNESDIKSKIENLMLLLGDTEATKMLHEGKIELVASN